MTQERWIQVTMPHATFGLHIINGQIAEAPPIARWAIGQPETKVASYYQRKGARFRVLNPGNTPNRP